MDESNETQALRVSTEGTTTTTATTGFKVYKRRWLYLTCICLANMSNAIV